MVFFFFFFLRDKWQILRRQGISSTKGKVLLIREQNLEKKEQIDSEKIDSTHFERQEDFSIASGEVGKGRSRQKWQGPGEGL